VAAAGPAQPEWCRPRLATVDVTARLRASQPAEPARPAARPRRGWPDPDWSARVAGRLGDLGRRSCGFIRSGSTCGDHRSGKDRVVAVAASWPERPPTRAGRRPLRLSIVDTGARDPVGSRSVDRPTSPNRDFGVTDCPIWA